ncbi:hypothetical protein [Rhizobium sp. 1399]|uniref:hypothetical protein n=1 Tax=Rhizobium sp. 1399 TaxID=2817758 RepID=UPI00286B2D3D|nr:hypothetical protein [Rhizobium sp. 1399]
MSILMAAAIIASTETNFSRGLPACGPGHLRHVDGTPGVEVEAQPLALPDQGEDTVRSGRMWRWQGIEINQDLFNRIERTVRQVAGFEGLNNAGMDHDVVVIGIGYDHNLVGQVIANKESARVVQLHCFPSLSGDMYQESILRLARVSAVSTQNAVDLNFFATANDPYVTAAVLDEAISLLNSKQRISNLYLSPLSTKPQALGLGCTIYQV